jgi:hypothetical protein
MLMRSSKLMPSGVYVLGCPWETAWKARHEKKWKGLLDDDLPDGVPVPGL